MYESPEEERLRSSYLSTFSGSREVVAGQHQRYVGTAVLNQRSIEAIGVPRGGRVKTQ
jgi:hypothetical protein